MPSNSSRRGGSGGVTHVYLASDCTGSGAGGVKTVPSFGLMSANVHAVIESWKPSSLLSVSTTVTVPGPGLVRLGPGALTVAVLAPDGMVSVAWGGSSSPRGALVLWKLPVPVFFRFWQATKPNRPTRR